MALWENKNEQNRNAQLEMLESALPSARKDSDLIMLSSRGSSLISDANEAAEEALIAESRASFILEKHSPHQVGFADTIEKISGDNQVKQQYVED